MDFNIDGLEDMDCFDVLEEFLLEQNNNLPTAAPTNNMNSNSNSNSNTNTNTNTNTNSNTNSNSNSISNMNNINNSNINNNKHNQLKDSMNHNNTAISHTNTNLGGLSNMLPNPNGSNALLHHPIALHTKNPGMVVGNGMNMNVNTGGMNAIGGGDSADTNADNNLSMSSFPAFLSGPNTNSINPNVVGGPTNIMNGNMNSNAMESIGIPQQPPPPLQLSHQQQQQFQSIMNGTGTPMPPVVGNLVMNNTNTNTTAALGLPEPPQLQTPSGGRRRASLQHIPPQQQQITTLQKSSSSNRRLSCASMTSIASTTSTPSKISFPCQLHEMLTKSEENNMHSPDFTNIVSWSPHGRSFIVHDTSKFVAEVLPKFFNHTKFSSFQRQLNSYGFRRFTRKGRDHGAYYHDKFLRGRSNTAVKISRLKAKLEPLSSTAAEVLFYSMPFIGQDGVEVASVPTNTNIITANGTTAVVPALPPPMITNPTIKTNDTSNTTDITTTTTNTTATAPNTSNTKPPTTTRRRRRSFAVINKNTEATTGKKTDSKTTITPTTTRPSSSSKSSKKETANKQHPTSDTTSPSIVQKSAKIYAKKIAHGILPLNKDHPLDQVTFFIPLDLLLS